MSTNSIPIMIEVAFDTSNIGKTNTSAQSKFYLPERFSWGTSNAQGMQFWILDRANPTADPVFTAVAPDSTSIPDGITPYLTDDYIMIASIGAWVTNMPQGDLYNLLRSNGGGLGLTKLELMANPFKCGISSGLVYILASVPGGNHSGIEFQTVQAKSRPSNASGTTYELSPFVKMLSLLPVEESGKILYTPIEMQE